MCNENLENRTVALRAADEHISSHSGQTSRPICCEQRKGTVRDLYNNSNVRKSDCSVSRCKHVQTRTNSKMNFHVRNKKQRISKSGDETPRGRSVGRSASHICVSSKRVEVFLQTRCLICLFLASPKWWEGQDTGEWWTGSGWWLTSYKETEVFLLPVSWFSQTEVRSSCWVLAHVGLSGLCRWGRGFGPVRRRRLDDGRFGRDVQDTWRLGHTSNGGELRGLGWRQIQQSLDRHTDLHQATLLQDVMRQTQLVLSAETRR